MPVAKETIEHVKRWEGLRLEAYPDPGSKDGTPWSIGYGHTSDRFMTVHKGLKITEAQAEAALEHDLGEAEDILRQLVKVPLTDGQRAALTSFVFNIGEGQFAGSTLLRKLNAGDHDVVPDQLARWVYNDGKKMTGLSTAARPRSACGRRAVLSRRARSRPQSRPWSKSWSRRKC